jgi:hypothetical protein
MKLWHAVTVICMVACGCGKGGAGAPDIRQLPVKGTVTFDGQPLAGADVVFMTGFPPAAFGARTNDDGTYQLQTIAGREAECQGDCKVTISRMIKPDGSPLAPGETPANVGAVEELPAKYSQFERTTLSATVAGGEATIDFALTSK